MGNWIYVEHWDRFQHYHDRAPAWIKLHLVLLGNDAWLELSTSDRCLLITVWMLTGRYGNGRVKADEVWLKSQAKAHRGKLKRLEDAGFIRIRARRGLEPVYQSGKHRGSKEPKEKERARRLAARGAATARVDTEDADNGTDPAVRAKGLAMLKASIKKVEDGKL